MKDFLRRLAIEEDGPTAVEYAVMLALIVVVCVASIGAVGSATAESMDDSMTKIAGAVSS